VQAGDFKRLGETAYSTGESDLSITNLTAMLRKCARKILSQQGCGVNGALVKSWP